MSHCEYKPQLIVSLVIATPDTELTSMLNARSFSNRARLHHLAAHAAAFQGCTHRTSLEARQQV